MKTRIIALYHTHKHQFSRYFVVGFSGFLLDIASLFLITHYTPLSATVAIIFTQLAVMWYNFFLNKHWSFGSKGLAHRQFIRYLTLAGGNYLFSIGIMYVFNHELGFSAVLVRIATIAVMTAWNFILYKKWVYVNR
ncbi:MAG: GtrA family protein [Candidatus Magasanikbacteria bacterium]|jgi:putative flippase GtrA|nr:GtrA family protein [Candidatus Magasanikbacteria bacterium]